MNQRKIASMLGISQATVSTVLKNPNTKKVSPQRRKEILNFVENSEYVYRPANTQTGVIGYLFPGKINGAYNGFYDRFLAGVQEAAKAENHNVLIHKYETNDTILSFSGKVDGIIFEGCSTIETIRRLSRQNPLVLLNSAFQEPELLCDCVEPDDFSGIEIAMRHLIENGHRRIAFFSRQNDTDESEPLNPHCMPRLNAYLDSCRIHGLEINENYIFQPCIESTMEATELRVAETLEKIRSLPTPPTAVVCFNDLYALLFLSQGIKMGLNLPADLSVIGMDNLSEGVLSTPKLTSVEHNAFDMGRLSVEMLLRRIDNQDKPFCRLNCPAELVSRESVAKV